MAGSATEATRRAIVKFAQGLGLIVCGAVLARSPFALFGAVLVFFGVVIAGNSFARLARLVALGHLEKSPSLHAAFARSTLPRKVFWLLLAVAEVDGRAGPREKDLVRRFLMERFVDPVNAEDLRSWTAQRIPTDQVGPLTQRLRIILSHAECETVFFWCCLVAFADDRFNPEEHRVLQEVAQAFGFPPQYARRIFHQAKQRHFSRGADERPAQTPADARQRAYEILGLEPSATADQIRSRHRELAKAHHPDTHAHLGPVAAQEATQRFRQIQEAYELLTAGR